MTEKNPQLRSNQTVWGKKTKALMIFRIRNLQLYPKDGFRFFVCLEFFFILVKNRMKKTVKRKIFGMLWNCC